MRLCIFSFLFPSPKIWSQNPTREALPQGQLWPCSRPFTGTFDSFPGKCLHLSCPFRVSVTLRLRERSLIN